MNEISEAGGGGHSSGFRWILEAGTAQYFGGILVAGTAQDFGGILVVLVVGTAQDFWWVLGSVAMVLARERGGRFWEKGWKKKECCLRSFYCLRSFF